MTQLHCCTKPLPQTLPGALGLGKEGRNCTDSSWGGNSPDRALGYLGKSGESKECEREGKREQQEGRGSRNMLPQPVLFHYLFICLFAISDDP